MHHDYLIRDCEPLLSPSLVIFKEHLKRNLSTMIAMAGSADRLRPHVKTHKMSAIVKLESSLGITRHKCATIAEAEMIAQAGGLDVLISYPMVGPNVARLASLIERYPATVFRATAEDTESARRLSQAMARSQRPLGVLVDLDIGMGRTGIDVESAFELYRVIADLPGLEPDGLHAYDGHRREFDPEERRVAATGGVKAVLGLRDRLVASGLAVPRLVLGGTPSFPIHAGLDEPGVELSPGTCPLHDHGYATKFPDLPFVPAAILLTRVISKRDGAVTLDLGHKAVAADPAGDRLRLLGVDEARLGPQSEEHLVIETSTELAVGTPLLAIPTHVCPTVALHRWAYVVEGGEVVDRWNVDARDRVLTI